MKCDNCGQENAVGSKFCTWCGNELPMASADSPMGRRDLGQLISYTFELYRNNFQKFFLLALPIALVNILPAFVFTDLIDPNTIQDDESLEEFLDQFGTFFGAIFSLVVISGVIGLFVQGAVSHAVGTHYSGKQINVTNSYFRSLSNILALIVAMILVFLALAISFPLMIFFIGIPLAIFIAISFAFVVPIVMLEGAGPIDALQRSYNLVKGSRMRVLGIGIVFILLVIGLNIPFSLISLIVGDSSLAVETVITAIGQVLITPVTGIGLTVVYFDLRIKREGELVPEEGT